MREPIYRVALKKSFQLVLHHKVLWIFGVLSLLLGQLGWNNFIGSLTIFSNEQNNFLSYFLAIPWNNVWQGGNFFWSLWLLFLLVAISVAVILLAVISEGALIAAATSWYKGVKIIKIDETWNKGVKNFKRLLAVHLGKKFFLVLLLVTVNALTAGFSPTLGFANNISIVFIITVGLFFALAVSTIGIFASGYVVDRDATVIESVKRGYGLFKEHLMVSLELSMILLAVQMFVIMLFIFMSTWFLVPFVSFSVLGGLTGSFPLILTGLMSSVVLFFIVAALIGGILNAFVTSSWMYLFMKMDHEGVGSKILHLFRVKRN
jgi:hypothetical protein